MRRSLLAILLVWVLTCGAGLGRPALTDSDEAFYAEAAREMMERGDFLTPTYNYAHRFQKPVLYYWAIAGGYALTGVSEAAARFPSALSGLGLALLAWSCGRRWFGETTGRLAGLLLATSLGLVTIARLALPDLPLAFFMSLSVWAAVRAWLEDPGPRFTWLAVAAAAAGAAFLTKGPVGIVVPALVIVPLVMVERRSGAALRPAPLLVALVVFALIGLPWYWLMYREHGTAYLESFFVGDNLERFATDRFNDPRPLWFYIPIVIAGMLPWSPFFALWVRPVLDVIRRQRRLTVVEVRLAAWSVLPLVLFTASVGKQPRYILPALLPLAVGLAASIRRRLDDGSTPGRVWTGSALVASVVLIASGAVVIQVPAELVGAPAWRLAAGGAVLCGLGIVAAAAAVGRPRLFPAVLLAGSIALFVVLQFGVLAPPGPETVQQVAARIRSLLGPGVRWTTHEVFVRNLVFYVGTEQSGPFDEAGLAAFLKSPAPALAVVSDRDVPRLEAVVGRPLGRLAEWRYFNVAGVRWRHLITRNPGRSFRTVVLVTNTSAVGTP